MKNIHVLEPVPTIPLGAGGGHARGAHRPGPSAGGGISGMCGRYFLDDTKEANERLLNLLRGLLESGDPLASQVHTGEIFPTQLAPVIVADGGGVGVRAMRWGFPRAGGPGAWSSTAVRKRRFYPHVPARGAGAPLPGAGFRLLRMAAHSLRRKNEGKIRLSIAGRGRQGADVPGGLYGDFWADSARADLTASPSSRARPMSRCALTTTACP